MGNRYLILANPKAGGAKVRAAADLKRATAGTIDILQSEAARIGLDARVEAVPFYSKLRQRLNAAWAAGYDTVVAAGGDGTVRPIAQAVVGTPLRFGILPVGTDNNFAHSLGIPFDLDGALRVLRDGSAQRVDVGRIGDENFTEAAGVGLFANLIAAFGPSGPARCQWLSCLRTAARILRYPPKYHLRLTLDGIPYEEEAIMVSVCNSIYIGESWALAPDAELDDGLFDVVIVGALSRLHLLGFARAILQGRALEFPGVTRIRAKKVEIRRDAKRERELPVHADDHISAFTPAHFEVVPRVLPVMTCHPRTL